MWLAKVEVREPIQLETTQILAVLGAATSGRELRPSVPIEQDHHSSVHLKSAHMILAISKETLIPTIRPRLAHHSPFYSRRHVKLSVPVHV